MQEELWNTSQQIRKDILDVLYKSQSGHPGGALSCVEILLALYGRVMQHRPEQPKWEHRDRFVLSKGHGCAALYAVLAHYGYFSREHLWNFRQLGAMLQGHPDCLKTPGVDASTGSLGQGASVSIGMALAAKRNKSQYKVYTVLGDGECQEGLIWEAAMSAAHYGLNNLTFLLDHNGFQIDGAVDEVMSLGDICVKFAAFGWEVDDVDGHDIEAIVAVLQRPRSEKPRFIRCRTVKGKGISFMENQFGWHGKAPGKEDYEAAMTELESAR